MNQAPGQDSFDTKLREALANPDNLPAEFKNYMVQYIAQNPVPLNAIIAPSHNATGLGDAIQGTRYVGATTSGSPTTGYFKVGDFIIDQSGAAWVCTVKGDPGTWVEIGGGAGSGAEWFYASRVTNFTVTASNIFRIPWTHHVTSNSSVFSVTTSDNTDDTVNGLAEGIYIAVGIMGWATPQSYPHYCRITTDFFGTGSLAQTYLSDSDSALSPAGQTSNIGAVQLAITQSVPGEISFEAGNPDVSNHDVINAQYGILYLPNSTLVS